MSRAWSWRCSTAPRACSTPAASTPSMSIATTTPASSISSGAGDSACSTAPPSAPRARHSTCWPSVAEPPLRVTQVELQVHVGLGHHPAGQGVELLGRPVQGVAGDHLDADQAAGVAGPDAADLSGLDEGDLAVELLAQ